MIHKYSSIPVKAMFKMAALLLTGILFTRQAVAQAEFEPWGNFSGIRIKGQLIPFNTRLDVAGKGWTKLKFTGKEMQKPKYSRTGNEQTVVTQVDSFKFVETVTSTSEGKVELTVSCTPTTDTTVNGVYLQVNLPHQMRQGALKLLGNIRQSAPQQGSKAEQHYTASAGASFTLPGYSFTVKPSQPEALIVRTNAADTTGNQDKTMGSGLRLYYTICSGRLVKGREYTASYQIEASGTIDESVAMLHLDTTKQGRPFAGLGGNFRLQNPQTDPEVIDYCLKNLRVAWGRVEMPWRMWQPDMDADPIAAADNGQLNPHVKESMEMAQRLSRMNIPVIVTAWGPPQWAVTGKLVFGKSPEGIWGNPLNHANTAQIYKSITDYLLYLKNHYGVETTYYSFNESDLGINIRQTAAEHDELIKGLGAYFASHGLKTKLLLGDNSDANTYRFIYRAMNDPKARPYIGAVSFHSWRGWATETLQHWADAAQKLNVPLLVGEGSIDAAAWAYPAYFEEPSYALNEISLYTRLLAICQPLSILQWQLTADYSPLAGGGIFGDNGPLRPTQRFWNLKQLSSTPANLYSMPINSNKSDITCAALGDAVKHSYTIHMVNNSAARQVHLTGLPASVKELKAFVTDEKRNMEQMRAVKVNNHQANFTLDARCYVTLISE